MCRVRGCPVWGYGLRLEPLSWDFLHPYCAVQVHTDALEDIAVDIPLAPQILGKFLAALMETQHVVPQAFEELFAAEGAADAKRSIFKHAMKALVASLGQGPTEQLMAPTKGVMGPLLNADPVLDPGLPTIFDYVKMEGLQWAIA